MLKNLFKYEMRATAKTFIWLYIAFIIIAVVNALFVQWEPVNASAFVDSSAAGEITSYTVEPVNSVPNVLQVVLIILYMFSIAAIAIGTLVVVILRFYRNLLGDEGYLMMTLPVSREQLVLSKMLVALIWSVCSGVLIFLSVLLLIAGTGHFGDLAEGIKMIIAAGTPLYRWIVIIIISILVSTLSGILMLYAAMAIGPNLLKNRVGGSILAFIIIAVASQIITAVVMLVTTTLAGGSTLLGIAGESAAVNGSVNFGTPIIDFVINSAALSSIISSAAIAIACWFLTRYMLKRKLNLA